MEIYNTSLYMNSVEKAATVNLPWEKLANKKILVIGATGLIGRNLVDIIMHKNVHDNLNCMVTVMARNQEKIRKSFSEDYFGRADFDYICHDIQKPLKEIQQFDFILQMASNTHPRAYSSEPIDTILTNVYGLKNVLDMAAENKKTRVVFPSSVEIYGENRGDVEFFSEEYLGYINSNTMRAGYPESKRVCEALCQAYIKEKNLDVIIPRLPRIFGPTMGADDSKAAAQFIKKAVEGKDIVLKSDGKQEYSFLYMLDAAVGILFVMLNGENGEAYNLADESCDGQLREIAQTCADIGNSKVIFELPDEVEKAGYSTATKAKLDGTKIKKMGWKPLYSLTEGIEETIRILKEAN